MHILNMVPAAQGGTLDMDAVISRRAHLAEQKISPVYRIFAHDPATDKRYIFMMVSKDILPEICMLEQDQLLALCRLLDKEFDAIEGRQFILEWPGLRLCVTSGFNEDVGNIYMLTPALTN